MPRPVDSILTYNAGRDPERLAMKYRHMRSSAFVFLRATCHLFPAQLPQRHALPASPAVWSCGDLHLENFGSYKGDNRLPYFDVNDFDEGALIPAAWDLLRLLTSVRLACQPLDFDAARVRALLDALLAAYFGALRGGSVMRTKPEPTTAAPAGSNARPPRARYASSSTPCAAANAPTSSTAALPGADATAGSSSTAARRCRPTKPSTGVSARY